VLEVKGDFCGQVRRILVGAHREADYLEIGLNTGVCYNPLHNDLDPYVVAYAIASLLNNLFGKSKESFWQQAYTDLAFAVLADRPRYVHGGMVRLHTHLRQMAMHADVAITRKRSRGDQRIRRDHDRGPVGARA